MAQALHVLRKERRNAPISFGDDPDLRIIWEAVCGQEPQAIDERVFILSAVMLVELAPVSDHMTRESDSFSGDARVACILVSPDIAYTK